MNLYFERLEGLFRGTQLPNLGPAPGDGGGTCSFGLWDKVGHRCHRKKHEQVAGR